MPQIPVTTRIATDRPLVKVDNNAVANPPAGQGFSIVVPVGYRFQLLSMYLRFITDATVADRFIILTVSSPSGVLLRLTHATAILASETRHLTVAAGVSTVVWTASVLSSVLPFPAGIVLEEGSSIEVTVTGIQATDQFSLINSQLLSQFVAE